MDIEVYNAQKAEKHIKDVISRLDLDLQGQCILTEAGSNHFIYTPLISYFAGARITNVWVKDSAYGMAKDLMFRFYQIADILNIDKSNFIFSINERPVEHIKEANVITNLGSVRPLDKTFLNNVSKGAVISYMCEAWEIRPEDVDINYCRTNNIPIAGVWENHPDLLIFNGCGSLSVKICLEAGLEVYQNNILIVSNDKFGDVAYSSFIKFGAMRVTIISPEELSELSLSDYDLLFIADYSYENEIIGENLIHRIKELKKIKVVHLCGRVDYTFLKNNNISCYPEQEGHTKRMTRTLAHLGIKPVIDLHAAGLKVGELLLKGIKNDLVQVI